VELNQIVVVSLQTPREKIWGELLALHPAGITLRGIDLNSFDNFIRQVLHPEGDRVGLPTMFFPMHRIERISLDEPSGSIPSMADVFEPLCSARRSAIRSPRSCTWPRTPRSG